MDEKLVSGLIGFAGIVVGLIGRDFVMAPLLARWKRAEEVQDKKAEEESERHELVRIYSDPLLIAVRDLKTRLQEITTAGQARYLLVHAPKNEFVVYKRISTFYRLAALLGWIRAFRRERGYLDPHQQLNPDPTEACISKISSALADGQHIEEQRLAELMHLWRIPDSALKSKQIRAQIASEIDGIRQAIMDQEEILDVSDLTDAQKRALGSRCAEALSTLGNVEVSDRLIEATLEQMLAVMGIKEAYIYRDWQSAIGDMMISQVSNGPRRFEVTGFGDFENRYLQSKGKEAEQFDQRWFDRLETLFHDLDMSKVGMFDARREQINRLYRELLALEAHLEQKRAELDRF